MNMQKSKAGRKSLNETKKISRTITIDAELPNAVEDLGERNLSGFMNDATWKEIKRKRHNRATEQKPKERK